MGVFPEWAIGVIINICGSVAINFGTNLMKLSHNDKDRLREQLATQERTQGVRKGGP